MPVWWTTVHSSVYKEAVINIWIWNDLRGVIMEKARYRTMYGMVTRRRGNMDFRCIKYMEKCTRN